MKITSKSRYALEALVYMGSVGGENSEPRNVKSLTEGTGIPPRYLEQILFTLRKKRIIKTKRGPAGGYYIAADLSKLTAAEVVGAMGEEICVAPCVASRDECDNGFYERCVTREVWQRITGAVTERLEGITIGDLAADYAATQGKP